MQNLGSFCFPIVRSFPRIILMHPSIFFSMGLNSNRTFLMCIN
jgi:hypothetical protein